MARLHTQFRSIHRKTREAAQTLFGSKPWQGTDEEKFAKYERFLREASAVYSIPQPSLTITDESDVYGLVAPNTIVLDKFSVTSMFNAFRCHMQYTGAVEVEFPNLRDAQAWACSLFYTIRPILFRKRVREGRIAGVFPDDLLTTATLMARQDEVDEAFAGIVAESYEEDNDIEADEEAEVEVTGEVQRVSVPEAAQRLGVSQSTVRNMISDGRLRSERDGRRVIVLIDIAPSTSEQ